MYERYDITILYCNGSSEQVLRLLPYVKLEKFDKDKEYYCDYFIRNSVWGIIPNNIHWNKELRKKALEEKHADYVYLKKRNLLDEQYRKMDDEDVESVACGKYVAERVKEAIGIDSTVMENILAPTHKTQKVYKLITCTRIDSDKGWKEMQIFANKLKEKGYKFIWLIFTPNPQQTDIEEIKFMKPRYDIFDWLAWADWTVFCSRQEGHPYTLKESVQYRTPCIATDIPR